MAYAADTSVSTERSLAEIRSTLRRYNATSFGYVEDPGSTTIGFRIQNRQVKISVTLPDKADFAHTPERRTRRAPDVQEKAWEQGCRQRYRALALVIKAKLEAVEAGISTVEREFFSDLILPGGRTVAETLEATVVAAIEADQPLAITGGP